MDVLKIAILGLTDQGQQLLAAACCLEYFKLVAVADKDARLAEKIGEKYNCKWYDDYRQLIMQNQLDCLIVAEALYACTECVNIAIKNKTHILKAAPAAPDFETAKRLALFAKQQQVKFAIANPARFETGFIKLRQMMEAGQIEQTCLISAFCSIGKDKCQTWEDDKKLAGGGVLLRNCYQIIDQIILNFDRPEQVYAFVTSQAQDRKQRLFKTEDTCVVTLKFSEKLCANIVATRAYGVDEQEFKVYAKQKSVTIKNGSFVLYDSAGKIIEEVDYTAEKDGAFLRLMEDFAMSLILPDKPLCSDIEGNLANMAVIECAYLSSRTAMPEEPGRIFQFSQ